MTTWTKPHKVAFPVALLATANRLAAILDPDTGGDRTFSIERVNHDGTLLLASIPFTQDFAPTVLNRDLATWQTVIPQLAAAKAGVDEDGNPLPHDTLSVAEIETLHGAMLIGDEIPVETADEPA